MERALAAHAAQRCFGGRDAAGLVLLHPLLALQRRTQRGLYAILEPEQFGEPRIERKAMCRGLRRRGRRLRLRCRPARPFATVLLGFDRRQQFGDRSFEGRLRCHALGRAAVGDLSHRPAIGRHDIRNHARARIDRLTDAMAVITGNYDRIALAVDAGDDADMTAALAAAEHRDGTDFRLGNAAAVLGERFGGIGIGAGIAELGEHHVHEGRAPQPLAVGRIGAEIFARFADQLWPAEHRPLWRFGHRQAGETSGRLVRLTLGRVRRNLLLLNCAMRLGAQLRGAARRRKTESMNAQRQQTDQANREHNTRLEKHSVGPRCPAFLCGRLCADVWIRVARLFFAN